MEGGVLHSVLMITEHQTLKSYLKEDFLEKTKKNSAFSMRAYAKQLGIAPSTLCQVLKGQRNLSTDMLHGMAQRLGLTDTDAQYFVLVGELDSSKNPERRCQLMERLNSFREQPFKEQQLDLDYFRSISDWYHFAILQLTRVQNKMSASSIAKSLGISKVEADLAMERLIRLGMMEETAPGQYSQTPVHYKAESRTRNAALNKFHKQYLDKSLTALDEQKPDERVSGSETFAISEKSFQEVEQLTKDYLKKIAEISNRDQNPTSVYHCQVNAFKLTKNEKEVVGE
jgi:uncharacterized protein (TIGR02147 family)